MTPCRTIKSVAQQTGLTVHTIRAWEKRHGAVRPVRTANQRRLYSARDVARLKLLRHATLAGHAIGQIAQISLSELQRLTGESVNAVTSRRASARPSLLIATAIDAITAIHSRRLQDVLDRAAIELGSPAVLLDFIAPLAHEIGERWRTGELSVAQEHFATNLISVFLNIFARPYAPNSNAPHLLLATPCGQHHELGAQLAAAAARSHGWNTTYFGACLPVEELLRAADVLQPRAVGLSIVFPSNDRALRTELRKLDRYLPAGCIILLGGKCAEGHKCDFARHRPVLVPHLRDLFAILERLERTKPVRPRART